MNILRKKQVDKAKALGYPSDVNVLYKELPVTKFVEHETPTVLLQHATEIFFDDDAILNHPSTTAEIQACCKDIRVLGRKDIRNLLKWWKTLHEEKVAADKKAAKEEEGEDGEEKTAKEDEEESMDEEEKDLMRVSKEIDVLKDEERRELKRKKKKVSKERTKLADKMNLKMLLKGDLGPTENDDEEIFRLSQIRTMDQLDLVTGSKPEIVAESDDEVMEVKSKKIRYDVEKSQLDDSGLYYNNPEDSDDLEFESEDEDADDIEKTVEKKLVEAEFDSDEEDGLGLEVSDDEAGSDTDGPPRQKKQKKDKANKKDAKNKKKMTAEELAKWGTVDEHPLITKLDNRTQLDRRVAKANMWFDKDVFKNVEKEDDEDFELDKIATILKEKGKSVRDQRRSKWDEEEAKDERERRKALGKEVGPKKSVSFLNSERGEVEMERKKKVVKAEEEEDGYGTDSDTYTTDSDDDDRNLDDDFGSDYDINDVFNDDDDDDDGWMGSLDSDSEQLDDVDTLPNPEVLNKPQPKHTWFPVQEIVQRQYGHRTKYQSPSLFQQRYYGSLHAVQRFELMYKLEKHHGCVNALDFHPSGHLLASASDDRKVVIWDWATGQPLYSYSSGHSSNVFQSKWLHLAGSSGFVVTSARDGLIRLADFGQISGSGGRSTQLIAKHKRSAHKLSVMKDTPHVILSVGEDGRVLSVDVRESCAANSKEILSLKKRKNSVLPLYSVASNPLNSCEFIVAGEDTQVHLFDRRFMFTKTAKPLKKFCPDTIKKDVHYYITCAVYNYSGTEILASYNDEKIYLFDSRAACVPDSTVSEYLHCYEGHRNSATVKGVNFFGPKSQYVVSGSDDGYIYIWDKNTEAIVNWMRGDDDGVVNCIEGHPDVPVLATSGLDSNVKIWVPSCEQAPTFENLKKTLILNEKKRGRINSSMGTGSLPIYSHFRWLWQNTFDSARSGDPLTMSREDGEEDSGDEDDPRQCAPS
uniref:DDB1- and CUL4-associated factor 8 n=1 Tax=Cacopsylla melanoneura TaxID=428564 RepID=A0A8D8R600_9HEMI